MKERLNPKWVESIRDAASTGNAKPFKTGDLLAAQAYVLINSEFSIPVKVVNLGAGIKHCIPQHTVCQHCGGKGYK